MNQYTIELKVDEKWLEAIKQFTGEVYEGETCTWIKVEEIVGDREDPMRFLIKWKDNGEESVHTFGVLPEGESGEDQPNDDQIFYWLTSEEALEIGADYDGGDWVVIRCACDECEYDQEEENE